jgi:hypothetical protein
MDTYAPAPKQQKWKKRGGNYTSGSAINTGGGVSAMAKGGLVPHGKPFIAGDSPKPGKENVELIEPTAKGLKVTPITRRRMHELKKKGCDNYGYGTSAPVNRAGLADRTGVAAVAAARTPLRVGSTLTSQPVRRPGGGSDEDGGGGTTTMNLFKRRPATWAAGNSNLF